MKIEKVHAREIIDSRGNPTVEVEVTLENGVMGRASVPSGASTGENEALELRDGDKKRFGGKGVLKAVENVNDIIAPELKGFRVTDQRAIDYMMLHSMVLLPRVSLAQTLFSGVSLAVAQTAAKALDMPLYRYIGGVNAYTLPVPMMNIINGGAHSDAPIAFQEFMIRPVGADNIREALRMGAEIFHTLAKNLKKRGLSTAVGDEGGFAPKFEVSRTLSILLCRLLRTQAMNLARILRLLWTALLLNLQHKRMANGSTIIANLRMVCLKILMARSLQLMNKLLIWKNSLPNILSTIENGLDENDWETGLSLQLRLEIVANW